MRITFKGNGLVWDQKKEMMLCKFEGGHYENSVWIEGEFTTDDPRTIELLKNYPTVPADAMQYYRKEQAEVAGDNFEGYTVADLKSFAKNNKIDLGDATKKADIITILRK